MPAPADTTLAERAAEDLSWAGLVVAEGLRAAELTVIAVIVLLVSPPLLILLVIVAAGAVAVGLVASVVALPVLVARHLHRRRPSRRG
jgi:hypothetical protein